VGVMRPKEIVFRDLDVKFSCAFQRETGRQLVAIKVGDCWADIDRTQAIALQMFLAQYFEWSHD